MPSVILTNWTVYYADDAPAGSSGYKQIRWTGSGDPETTTNTVNELYSALMDLFSIPAQNNAHDTTPIRAVTPTVYEIGAFDQRDQEAWFIDPDSVKHLTNGSLSTVDWTRVENADANVGTPGIIKVPYTVGGGSQFANSDWGRAIANGSATGTLLWHDATNSEAWIRPTNCTSTHNWAGPAGTISVTGGTGSVTQNGAGVWGERVWANIYSIGTISSQTQLYVTQDFTNLTPWWGAGHLDRLFLTSDGFDSGLMDQGLLTVYARQYTKFYDHFKTDASEGGRNPIPLATSADVNNTTGYRTMTLAGVTPTFNVGNYVYRSTGGLTWSTTDTKGVITAVSGNDITYYLIGDLTDFVTGTDDVQEYTGTGDGDASATSISNVVAAGPTVTPGPADLTVNFGYISRDISDGFGTAPYSVEIDLLTSISLSNTYERLKYLTRRGATGDIDNGSQTVTGEQYVGVGDILLPYDGQSTTFVQGEALNGQTSGATGTLTADNTVDLVLTLRDVRGTFLNNENIRSGATVRAVANIPSGATTISPTKVSPFGTKAGDNFFGAQGVWLANVPGSDANNYEVIDNNGVSHSPPASVAITVNGILSGDRVSVFRTTDANGTINRTYLTSHASNNAIGDTTFDVDAGTPIPADTPSSGRLRVVDNPSPLTEQHYRYSSWSGTTFTLLGGFPSGTNDVEDVTGKILTDTSATFVTGNVVRSGDLIRNTTDGSWAQIISVVSETQLSHSALQGGSDNQWDISDSYSFNNLPVNYNGSDTAYVPYIDATATSTSISTSVQYVTDRNISTQVRKKGIVPFNVNNISLTSSGYTATAVRTTDSIVT